MKFKSLLYTGIFLFLLPLQGHTQRMVGYVTSYATAPVLTGTVQYNKLTDVIFCFLNPDATNTGALQVDRVGSADFDFEMDKFQIVKSKCYPMTDNGPKLWIAIGGAGGGTDGPRPTRLNTVCNAVGTRTTFCNNLVQFAITHELEGFDIDWEFPNTATEADNFRDFIILLRDRIDALKPSLKISVAVGGEAEAGCGTGHTAYWPATPSTLVADVDYWHIMTYDLPNNATYNVNHSTLSDGNSSLNGWNTCRGIPKSKMCMGVPFYGWNSARSVYQNYNAMGAGANASDNLGGTYYYNGDATIAAKIDAVRSTHGAAGIIIWDVTLDKAHSTGQSLLSAAYTKMFGDLAANPCSTRPYLGKDTTMCITASPTLTLNPGVASTSGAGTRTFAWTKDGVATGGNTSTLGITSSGTYKVTITQGTTNCVLTDEIVVSQQTDAPTPTASPTTVCASGTASSTLSSASSVQWYTSSTGGATIATGTSTSVSPSVTTTYYTQGTPSPTNKRYFGGRPYMDNSTSLWNERTANVTQTTRPEWVQVLTVYQPVTLTSVVVYLASATAHNPVSIMIMDGSVDGSTTLATVPTQVSANQTTTVAVAAHPTTEPWTGYPNILNVNITFQPGTYYVGLYNPDGSVAPEYAVVQTAMSYPSGVAGIFSIGGNARQNYGGGYGVPGTHYGQIFDWRFTSAALSQCSRKSVTVTYDCPAPVELISFTGENNNHKNFLSWITASETNNNYFNIERSADGINYEVIGNVDGSGNTREMVSYSFVDQSPLNGNNYYRLAQYDFDGTVSYKVIVVNNNHQVLFEISPNPFDNSVLVKSNITDHARIIQVSNVQGAIVYEERMDPGVESVRLGSSFSAGVYFIKIMDGETSYNYKIVKK